MPLQYVSSNSNDGGSTSNGRPTLAISIVFPAECAGVPQSLMALKG